MLIFVANNCNLNRTIYPIGLLWDLIYYYCEDFGYWIIDNYITIYILIVEGHHSSNRHIKEIIYVMV